MKKQQVICDRCKRETDEGRELIIIRKRDYSKECDLCSRCFDDLKHFMEGRTLADIGRDLFR